MKDNDFRQLVDREFAPLEWTDAQRLSALNRMQKEVHPIMKRKALIAIVLVISIMVVSAAALAVSAGMPTMQEMIDQDEHRAREYDYEPFTVPAEAVVTPLNQRHTSQLVNIEATEAFLTAEAFYMVIHITPARPDAVLWDQAAPIVQDGAEVRYSDLYRQKGFPLLTTGTFTLHSPLNAADYTLMPDYSEVRRDADGKGVVCLLAYALPDDELIPLHSSTVMGKFAVQDCRTTKWEYNAFMFDLPRMTVSEIHDSFLIN